MELGLMMAWGCEYCFSFECCNCEEIISQQDAEAKETEEVNQCSDLGPSPPGDMYVAPDGTTFISRRDYLEYIRGRR